MKNLLAAIVLAIASFSVFAEHPQIEMYRQELQRQVPDKEWRVTDTGDVLDIGEGPGPVVIVTYKGADFECLVTLHPTEKLEAVLGCVPVTPELGV